MLDVICKRIKTFRKIEMPAKTRVSQIIVSTVAEICAFKII
jgi:hypothetical protein